MNGKWWRPTQKGGERLAHPALCRPRASCPTFLGSKADRSPEQSLTPKIHGGDMLDMRANDPSAGSPTETLLRLLLPLSDQVHQTFHYNVQKLSTAAVRIIHRITQSVGATGGVYKGQGRNQHELMTRAY